MSVTDLLRKRFRPQSQCELGRHWYATMATTPRENVRCMGCGKLWVAELGLGLAP